VIAGDLGEDKLDLSDVAGDVIDGGRGVDHSRVLSNR